MIYDTIRRSMMISKEEMINRLELFRGYLNMKKGEMIRLDKRKQMYDVEAEIEVMTSMLENIIGDKDD